MRGLGKLLLGTMFLTVVSCVSIDKDAPSPTIARAPVVQEDRGQQVERHLKERYSDTSANCGSDSRPAFLCNGIMIRGTASNPNFHVWDNSAASNAKGGVSFSYLRAGTNFNKLAYNYDNGYIFTAYLYESVKIHPEVLCFFPIDAGTAARADKGCGAYPGYAGSQACHLTNITTAQQWYTWYMSHAANRHSWQCGFDVRDTRNTLAGPAFAAGVAAMKLIGTESLQTQSELIVATWGNGRGKELPIEAFFYLYGSATGLRDAKRNQKDLKVTHNILRPVISIRLATTQAGTATFKYLPADQTEPMPPVK